MSLLPAPELREWARRSRALHMPRGLREACTLVCAVFLSTAVASPLPFSDRDDGISCPFYDVYLGAGWPSGKPEGVDSDGTLGGLRPFATAQIVPTDLRRVRRLDLTALVQSWWLGQRHNDGLILRVVSGDMLVFHSREAQEPALRPQLILQGADGRRRYLEPVADATLDCSTYRGLGGLNTLTARTDTWVALRFDLKAAMAATPAPPALAELVLVRTPGFRPNQARLDVFAVKRPIGQEGAPRADGIARRHPGDEGIAADLDVFFADGFEAHGLDWRWAQGMKAPAITVRHDQERGFQSLSGRALRITIPKGQQLGLDLRYRFRDRHGDEPEEVFFRYYLRLAQDWLLAADGGKLPGLAGTYGQAGWGGRPWDGNKGWSLRGSFNATAPKGHLAYGRVMLGTYAYHSWATEIYGEGLAWISGGLAGLIEPNRWYCIEQHVKLNTPGKNDGMIQAWVDGQLALSRNDIRLRDRDGVRIEEVWMNFFHGGTARAPEAMHAFIDNVVIARKYIGPLAR